MGVWEDNFRNEKSEALLEKLQAEAEKMGLYYKGGQFIIPPEMQGQPDPPVFLQAVFLVGEKAFDAATLETDPEQKRFDDQFSKLAAQLNDPTSDIIAQMTDASRRGKDIFDLDFDDDDLRGLTD